MTGSYKTEPLFVSVEMEPKFRIPSRFTCRVIPFFFASPHYVLNRRHAGKWPGL